MTRTKKCARKTIPPHIILGMKHYKKELIERRKQGEFADKQELFDNHCKSKKLQNKFDGFVRFEWSKLDKKTRKEYCEVAKNSKQELCSQ